MPIELFQETAFPDLVSIDLSRNALKGVFPSPIQNIKLQILHLESNQLEQQVDPIITQFPALQSLDLTSNRFTGSLPSDWSAMTNLGTLLVDEDFCVCCVFPCLFCHLKLISCYNVGRNVKNEWG